MSSQTTQIIHHITSKLILQQSYKKSKTDCVIICFHVRLFSEDPLEIDLQLNKITLLTPSISAIWTCAEEAEVIRIFLCPLAAFGYVSHLTLLYFFICPVILCRPPIANISISVIAALTLRF